LYGKKFCVRTFRNCMLKEFVLVCLLVVWVKEFVLVCSVVVCVNKFVLGRSVVVWVRNLCFDVP